MPIGDLWDLLADLLNIYELVEEIRAYLAMFGWGVNALLDLFLHAMWSGAASLFGLLLAYWAARLVVFILAPRAEQGRGLSFTIIQRVVLLCVLAQFAVDILGHAYAVFRQGLPVTLGNLAQHAARDFHAEAWAASLVVCGVAAIYLLVRLAIALKHKEDRLPERLEPAMRGFGYIVALFASLSAHMWWDRILGPF